MIGGQHLENLEELVGIYNRNYARKEDWKLSEFKKGAKMIEDLIEDAVWGIEPRLNRDRHQFRVPKKTLEEMTKILKDPKIIAILKRCESFDDIFTIVYECRIKNFGSLSVYDTSLRLGSAFGYYPVVVYLHQGALEGAIQLLGKDVVEKNSKNFCNNPDYSYIPMNVLPESLKILQPYHIENFLCINKNKLKKA